MVLDLWKIPTDLGSPHVKEDRIEFCDRLVAGQALKPALPHPADDPIVLGPHSYEGRFSESAVQKEVLDHLICEYVCHPQQCIGYSTDPFQSTLKSAPIW